MPVSSRCFLRRFFISPRLAGRARGFGISAEPNRGFSLRRNVRFYRPLFPITYYIDFLLSCELAEKSDEDSSSCAAMSKFSACRFNEVTHCIAIQKENLLFTFCIILNNILVLHISRISTYLIFYSRAASQSLLFWIFIFQKILRYLSIYIRVWVIFSLTIKNSIVKFLQSCIDFEIYFEQREQRERKRKTVCASSVRTFLIFLDPLWHLEKNFEEDNLSRGNGICLRFLIDTRIYA